MKFPKIILLASISFVTMFLFSSCGLYPSGANNKGVSPYLAGYQPTESKSEVGYWDGDGVTGEPMIKINLDRQKAFFYKGGKLVGETPISTGSEGRNTPRGSYKITEKDEDHVSSLYGVIKDNATGRIVVADAKTGRDIPKPGQTFVNAPMQHWLRYDGAIGMHRGHLPGYPASHGCVRLPAHMAEVFYNNARLGTPVIVE